MHEGCAAPTERPRKASWQPGSGTSVKTVTRSRASGAASAARMAIVPNGVATEALDPSLSKEELGRQYRALRAEFERRTVGLASVAHELKTPLAILNGYADLLLGEKLGALNPAQKDVIAEMQSTRMRLQHFIEDFLNYSAIATGNLKLRIKPNHLNDCLDDICSVWLPRFQEKLVAFYKLDAAVIPEFPFDYFKVQHIVSNLLHNALKFTPAKGTVWLAAERYRWERRNKEQHCTTERRIQGNAQGNAAPNSVRVTVSDTGPGIGPEFHQEIFEDFSRAAGDGRSQGTGLGLAVARSLVHAHGGKIWVESEPGMGSKFCFLLPTSQKDEASAL